MKKKLAMLFVVIMLLSCMPVMAVTVPAGADTAAATTGTVTTQAASTGWIKVDKYYRYYYAKGKYYTNCVKKIENKLFGFSKKGQKMEFPVPPAVKISVGGQALEMPPHPVWTTEQNGLTDNTFYEVSMDVRSAQTAQSRILTAMTRRLRATAVRPVTWSS